MAFEQLMAEAAVKKEKSDKKPKKSKKEDSSHSHHSHQPTDEKTTDATKS